MPLVRQQAQSTTKDDSEIATQNENIVDDTEKAFDEEDTDDKTPANEDFDESESQTLTEVQISDLPPASPLN